MLYSLTFNSVAITLRTTRCNIQQFYMVFTLVYVFCSVRISQLTATFALHNFSRLVLYNRGGGCLLRGTDYHYIKQTHLAFKGLI